MKKRILVLLTVVVMAAMVVVMAAPAFAGQAKGQSNSNGEFTQNGHGDVQNDVAGSKNYGWSYAKGDDNN